MYAKAKAKAKAKQGQGSQNLSTLIECKDMHYFAVVN